MFSVDSGPGSNDIPNTAVYLGIEPAQFDYNGDTATPGSGRFEFDGPIIRFRLESSGLDLFLGTGGSITGLDEVAYFDAGIKASYGLNLVRQERFRLQIPLQLLSSITSVTSDQTFANTSQFQQGALVVGGGISVRARSSDNVRIGANFIPSYGFSFATGGTFGGSLTALEGQARLFLDRLFGNTGLSLGYDFKNNIFEIDGEQFDYDFKSHSFLVGITF